MSADSVQFKFRLATKLGTNGRNLNTSVNKLMKLFASLSQI